MTVTSLIGFGIVFMLVCGASSAALALLIPRLAHRGPAAERRAASLAAIVPVALGFAVIAVLVVESLVGVDHCTTHGHHAHLCLRHGMVWGERAWAVVAIAGCGAIVASRTAIFAAGWIRGAVLVSRLRSLAVSDDRVRLVDSERVFCFVGGIRRPTIYVSTAARAALADDEWNAMLAHERSHIAHRDLLQRLWIELSLVFAAPLAGIVIRERWDGATERLRDADAAADASPESVASALVRMARSAMQRGLGGVAAFTPTGDRALAERVHSLLDAAPSGERAASWIARIALAVTGALVALAMGFAEPLHHALETLLG